MKTKTVTLSIEHWDKIKNLCSFHAAQIHGAHAALNFALEAAETEETKERAFTPLGFFGYEVK